MTVLFTPELWFTGAESMASVAQQVISQNAAVSGASVTRSAAEADAVASDRVAAIADQMTGAIDAAYRELMARSDKMRATGTDYQDVEATATRLAMGISKLVGGAR